MISKTVTKSGASQMMKEWIEHNLFETLGRKKALDIFNNYEPFLTGVSKNGKKVETYILTNNAKQLKHIKL